MPVNRRHVSWTDGWMDIGSAAAMGVGNVINIHTEMDAAAAAVTEIGES